MAIQKGTNPFTGKLGDQIGKKVNGKFIIALGGGFTKERLLAGKDTIYKKSFENAADSGRCSKLAGTIIKMLSGEFESNKNRYAFVNLTGGIMNVVRREGANFGKLRPTAKTLKKLVGFHFNEVGQSTIQSEPQFRILKSGKIEFTFKDPENDLKWPTYRTMLAVEIFAVATHINFKSPEKSEATFHKEFISAEEAGASRSFTLVRPKGHCLLILGARFYEEVNGKAYLLTNQVYSPMEIFRFLS